MRPTRLHLIALATAATLLAGAPAARAQLANGGFDAAGPVFNFHPSYCYASYPGLLDCGTVPAWTGTFQVIASSSDPWNNPSDNGGWSAAQGQWLAGLQNGSHMAQTVTLAAGTYTLAWLESNRSDYGNGNRYEVRLDGQLLAGYETTLGAPWTAQSLQFQVGAGSHELRWQGVQIGGDGTSFIDSVTLAAQPVPEPQAALLMAAGLAALALGRRRARGG